MSLAVLAVIWHFWVGLVLFVATLGAVAAVIGGYFVKVVRPKYPPKR